MRRRVGDRRGRARFEIVGELFGHMEAPLRLPLKNVSSGGCLVESPVALLPDSMHLVTLRCGGREMSVQMRVRHVRSALESSRAAVYFIGLEFLALTPAIAEQVGSWMAASGGAMES